MKHRILSLLLALALLLPLCPAAPALSDGIVDSGISDDGGYYHWQPSGSSVYPSGDRYGIVVGSRLTVRNAPSTSGKSLGQIRNGQPVKIVGTSPDNKFYMVDLQSCGIPTVTPGDYGYAKCSLIKADPYFIATTKLTNLYATPWTMGLKNGEQGNRFFLVLEQSNNWYAVQTTEGSAGTSFILASDVGRYSSGYQANYVVTWDAPLFDDSWRQIRTLKRFSVGALVEFTGTHYRLTFREGNNEVTGWVQALYVAPLLN